MTFLTPRAYAQVFLLLPILGFFNNGIFSGFPIYLPELYPTRLRAAGAHPQKPREAGRQG